MSALISVIIPTYNGLELLRRTLEGLELQEPDLSFFEVIVVDDGSTDGTSTYILDYQGRLKLNPVILKSNRGRSVARNAGIAEADSDILLFLDADMFVGSRFVEGHLKAHYGQNIAIIGSVRFDHKKFVSGYSRYWETRGAQRNQQATRIAARYFLSGNSSVPANKVREISGFDEEISFYGEDIDFGLRLEVSGLQIQFHPNLLAIHLHSRSLSDTLNLLEHYGAKSLPLLITKHPQLLDDLRISWIEKIGFAGWIRRSLFTNIFSIPLRSIAMVLDKIGISSPIYTYLTFHSYYSGFKTATRQR